MEQDFAEERKTLARLQMDAEAAMKLQLGTGLYYVAAAAALTEERRILTRSYEPLPLPPPETREQYLARRNASKTARLSAIYGPASVAAAVAHLRKCHSRHRSSACFSRDFSGDPRLALLETENELRAEAPLQHKFRY